MFKTVLVPLDGSRLAERALPYAQTLVAPDGRLTLLRAAGVGLRPDGLHEADAYLHAISVTAPREGLAVERRVWDGQPSEAIHAAAIRRAVDAIVMATHGRVGVSRLLFGSVAEQVARNTLTPVVLIPPAANVHWQGGMRILLPLDGSRESETAIEPAVGLAKCLDAKLRLITILERGRASGDTQEYLAGVVARLRGSDLDADSVTTPGHAAAAIVQAAAQPDFAAIVMASHTRRALERLVVGSVTMSVVRHATVPVMVVRPMVAERVREMAPVAGLQITSSA